MGKARRLASRHLISTVLASRLVGQGIQEGDPPHWAAATLLRSEKELASYRSSLLRIRALFSSRGIPVVVLKGISLSFDQPRDIGDLDLLVPEARLLDAIGLLEGAGYAYVGHLRNKRIKTSEAGNWPELMKWANQFEFEDPEDGVLVEIHIAFFEKERVYAEDLSSLNASMGEILASCVPDPATGCLFLSIEDRALLLALHAAIKRAPYRHEFALRHVVDFDNLLDAGFDWEILIARAKRCGTLYHLYFLTCVYRLFMDGRIPAAIFAAIESSLGRAEKMLARLHLSCIDGLSRRSYGRALLYRFLTPFVLRSTKVAKLKSAFVLPLLFPESWRLAEIYSLPPTARPKLILYLLEPFRWIGLIASARRKG